METQMKKKIRLQKNFETAVSFINEWIPNAMALATFVGMMIAMFWNFRSNNFIQLNVGWVMLFSSMLFGLWCLARNYKTDAYYVVAPLLAGFAATLCCSTFVLGADNASANPFDITITVGLLTVILTYFVIVALLIPLAIYHAIFPSSS